MPPSLRWSDAWIMHAIGLASRAGRAPPAEIIAAADFTQHAIPTRDELNGAFVRLSQAGLIKLDAEGASLTQTGQTLLAGAEAGARGVHDGMAALAARIGAAPWLPGEDPGAAGPAAALEWLSQSEYEGAVRTYLMRVPGGGKLPPDAPGTTPPRGELGSYDGTLSRWARRHGLHVATRHGDEEVRAIRIVDDAGSEYEMWIDPSQPKRLSVSAWDFRDRRTSRTCTPEDLADTLESVYSAVETWIRDVGHTRTPAG